MLPASSREGAIHTGLGIASVCKEFYQLAHRAPNDTLPYQMRIFHEIERIHPLALYDDLCAKPPRSIPNARMGDKNFVRYCGYEAISLFRQHGLRPPISLGKR
jgi:hypothetical protein